MDSDNVHVRSTGLLTAVVGVKDVIVVTTQDAVLVIARDQGDRVKQTGRDVEGGQASRGDRTQADCTGPGATINPSTTVRAIRSKG